MKQYPDNTALVACVEAHERCTPSSRPGVCDECGCAIVWEPMTKAHISQKHPFHQIVLVCMSCAGPRYEKLSDKDLLGPALEMSGNIPMLASVRPYIENGFLTADNFREYLRSKRRQ